MAAFNQIKIRLLHLKKDLPIVLGNSVENRNLSTLEFREKIIDEMNKVIC